jgi:type IV pilus assembly protein PilO
MTKQMQQNLIAIALFAVMLIFVYFKYMITPLEIKHHDAISKLEAMQTKLDTMKRRAMDLPKLEYEMNELKQEVAELEQSLPREANTQEILRIVTHQAQLSDVRIQTFTPAPIVSMPNYSQIPFRITAQGTYHSIAKFLTEMGQESRIFSAENVSMVSNIVASKEIKTTVNVSFTLIGYTYKQ